MSTRSRLLFIALVCVALGAAVMAVMVGAANRSAMAADVEPGAPTTTFDGSMQPPDTLPVYFISGTPYEMGYQYGQQAKDLVLHNTCTARARALAKYGTWAAVVAAMQSNNDAIEAKTPEILDTMEGIADGAGVSFEEIALLSETSNASLPECSSIVAWGGATKGQSLIAGNNMDLPYLGKNLYGCVVVAHPDEGNSYIGAPTAAGTMSFGRGMNAKGLVILGSGGQLARPEDRAAVYPRFVAGGYVLQHCETAAQAKDMYLSLDCCGHGNSVMADTSGDAYVIEATAAAKEVRTSGDFGEKNYLLAGNIFLTETMLPALYPNQLEAGELDDWYRYYTVEKLVRRDYGRLTAGRLMAILGCHDYFGTRDPVTGHVDTTKPQRWHEDVLSTKPVEDERSIWTPGMRGISWTPGQRLIYDPGNKTAYIMTGNDDPLFSWNADATGEFFKLVLSDSPADVTSQALTDAQVQIWYGARALHKFTRPPAARLAKLNKAKAAVAEGMNLQSLAGLAGDTEEALMLLGKATTCFCQAQCYAEQAQGLVANSGTVPPGS